MKLDLFFKKSSIILSLSSKSTTTATLSTKSIDETLNDSSSTELCLQNSESKKEMKDIVYSRRGGVEDGRVYNKNGKTLLQKLFKPVGEVESKTEPIRETLESETKDFGISSEHIINDNDNIINKTSPPFLFRKLYKRRNKKSYLKYKNYEFVEKVESQTKELDFTNIYNNKNKYFYK